METVAQLRNVVAETAFGTMVDVTVLRDRKELTITVQIGELEKLEQEARAPGGGDLLGLTVEKVTSDIARRIGLKTATGVIVTRVEPESPAVNVGLTEGDIIFRVGGKKVSSPKEFSALVEETTKEGEVLLLLRDGRTGRVGYLVVPIG